MLAAVRNFVIVFLISAVVFGSIAWMITGFIEENILGIADSPETEGVDDEPVIRDDPDNPFGTPSGAQPSAYPDLDGASFSVLLIGTDYRPDDFIDYIENFSNGTYTNATLGLLSRPIRTRNADLMILVSVYEETRQIVFTCIPANTRVMAGGGYKLLNTCYDAYGVETIVDFVNYLTAVPIDYYIEANVTDAGSIIDIIDGVDVDVPANIINPYYNPLRTPENAKYSGITGDRDFKTYIAIEKGQAHIDSSNLFALLHFRTGAIEQGTHEEVLVSLARAVLLKSVSSGYISRASDLFTKAMKYANSNMSVSDLIANLDLFLHFDEFTVQTVSYPGTYSTLGDEPCFVPNVNDAYTLFRSYRQ